MNKKQIIYLSVALGIILITAIFFAIISYRPVSICKQIMPYAKDNYCSATSSKLSKIRHDYKLKYSLLDKKNLEQIFINIRDFQSAPINDMIKESATPEILGDIDKRNKRIDDIVANFIAYCENLLVDAENETRYHNRNKYSGTWINYDHLFATDISAQNVAEIKETLKNAKEEGVFPSDIATTLRRFRALGTPYCEIDSHGTITDCSGNNLGTVPNVLKPLGTNHTSDISNEISNADKKTTKSEAARLEKAIIQYKKDLDMYGSPKVIYDEDGMPMNEPNYSNSGMPKSLVLDGVSIICFEWANMGDKSRCSSEELNTIEKFFKENTNIDWGSEYFNYESNP